MGRGDVKDLVCPTEGLSWILRTYEQVGVFKKNVQSSLSASGDWFQDPLQIRSQDA